MSDVLHIVTGAPGSGKSTTLIAFLQLRTSSVVFDIDWLTPTVQQPPPLLADDLPEQAGALWGLWTMPYSVSGQPAISLPLHWTGDGLPIGVQLVADYGREDVLLRLAAQLEAAQPWAHRWPSLSGVTPRDGIKESDDA